MLIPAATTEVKMQARAYETGYRRCPGQNTSHSYPSSWSARHLHLEMCCFLSVAKPCLNLCIPMDCSAPDFPVCHHLLKYAQTHVPWVSDAIQPTHLLSFPSPPAFYLSQHQSLFQWVALPIKSPKYWSVSFSISPSNEYSGLISFRIDWFDLLAVQGTLKTLL